MNKRLEHFRPTMGFYLKKDTNAAPTYRKICDVFDVNAVKERVRKKYFTKFLSGNLSVQDDIVHGDQRY